MAPRARIAMYKALWSTQDGSTASGFNSDLVAAIDQAVADGVDVINYSIGPSSPPNNSLITRTGRVPVRRRCRRFRLGCGWQCGPGLAL